METEGGEDVVGGGDGGEGAFEFVNVGEVGFWDGHCGCGGLLMRKEKVMLSLVKERAIALSVHLVCETTQEILQNIVSHKSPLIEFKTFI